jgi:hypothetical protein
VSERRAKAVRFGDAEYGITFRCPGCGDHHSVRTHASDGIGVWGWNGSLETPTITPSVLVQSGHYMQPNATPGNCYCDFAERYPDKAPMPAHFKCYRCHSFVTGGRIQFLNDCSHALAGQTVDLPAIG